MHVCSQQRVGHPFGRVQGFVIPECTERVLFVCTSGCFTQVDFIDRLLMSSDNGLQLLPVIADEEFRVPSRDTIVPVPLTRLCPGIDGRPRSMEDVSSVILGLFLEIAVSLRAGFVTWMLLERPIAEGKARVALWARRELGPLQREEVGRPAGNPARR